MKKEERDECSIVYTQRILGMKWVIHILADLLLNGPQSFSELQEKLIDQNDEQITNRVLTDKLKLLEKEQIMHKLSSLDNKRSVYGLTKKGEDFRVIFQAMKTWGVKWGGVEQKKCKTYTCVHNLLEYYNSGKETDLRFQVENPNIG